MITTNTSSSEPSWTSTQQQQQQPAYIGAKCLSLIASERHHVLHVCCGVCQVESHKMDQRSS